MCIRDSYIHISGSSCPITESCYVQNSLCVKSCALVYIYIGSVTARHSSSGVVQGMELRNFRRGRHLYSAGRPSRWASAHILVYYVMRAFVMLLIKVNLLAYLLDHLLLLSRVNIALQCRADNGSHFVTHELFHFNLRTLTESLCDIFAGSLTSDWSTGTTVDQRPGSKPC